VSKCRSVVKSDLSYTKLKKLDLHEGKKNRLFADNVTLAPTGFLQQVQGLAGPTIERSRENTGHNAHVY